MSGSNSRTQPRGSEADAPEHPVACAHGQASPAGLDGKTHHIGDERTGAEAEREVFSDLQPHGALAADWSPGPPAKSADFRWRRRLRATFSMNWLNLLEPGRQARSACLRRCRALPAAALRPAGPGAWSRSAWRARRAWPGRARSPACSAGLRASQRAERTWSALGVDFGTGDDRLRDGLRRGHAQREGRQRRREPPSQPSRHCHWLSHRRKAGGAISRTRPAPQRRWHARTKHAGRRQVMKQSRDKSVAGPKAGY